MAFHCVWRFYYFSFEWNYNFLKSKSPCILVSKNIKNNNEAQSKLENSTHSFREMNLMLQLIKESWIKSKTAKSCSSRKKKECRFCNVWFAWRTFFKHFCFISMYIVFNILLKYICFYISKKNTSYIFITCFYNCWKPLRVSLIVKLH